MSELPSFYDLPIWFYLIVFVIWYIPLLWFYGDVFNPIARIQNYRENRRLSEAYKLGLTWEEYKKKHGL